MGNWAWGRACDGTLGWRGRFGGGCCSSSTRAWPSAPCAWRTGCASTERSLRTTSPPCRAPSRSWPPAGYPPGRPRAAAPAAPSVVPGGVPRSVVIFEFFLSASLLGGLRFGPRIALRWARRLEHHPDVERTLIIGDGGAAELLGGGLRRRPGHR